MAAAQGIGGNVRRRNRMEIKVRRTWNAEEEGMLLASLKELVSTGWKSDNGFRAGNVYKLEELMQTHFPRSNIRANPHITSKLTGWKKNYGSLAYILSCSGVGFNVYGDFTVDCDDEQWEQICNVDSNAKNIRGKSWPFYEAWVEVFGKDRATGTMVEDVIEAVNDLIIEDSLNLEQTVGAEAPVKPEEHTIPVETEDSEANSSRHEVSSSRLPKKRKQAENMDKQLCDLLSQMQRDTNQRLESISHRIGYQSDLGQARKEIWAMLDDIPELSMDEKFDISDVLIDKPQKLEFFSSLPKPARPAYVWRLLNANGA